MISGIYTILAMVSFAAIAYWAYARRNRARFEDAAQLPLSDEEAPLGVEPAAGENGGRCRAACRS